MSQVQYVKEMRRTWRAEELYEAAECGTPGSDEPSRAALLRAELDRDDAKTPLRLGLSCNAAMAIACACRDIYGMAVSVLLHMHPLTGCRQAHALSQLQSSEEVLWPPNKTIMNIATEKDMLHNAWGLAYQAVVNYHAMHAFNDGTYLGILHLEVRCCLHL